MQYLQKLGKALQFPIVVLPVVALLLRLGGAMNDASINPDLSQTGPLSAIWYIGSIFQVVGNAAISNLAPLFAIGLGFGMAKDFRGEAALVAFFGWDVVEGLVGIVPQWYYNNALLRHTPIGNFQDNQFWAVPHSQILYVFDFSVGDTIKDYGAKYNISMGVFGGILAGCLVALIYNKYSNVNLPAALGFLSGRRFVPMVTADYFLVGTFALAAIWPWFQLGLDCTPFSKY